MQLFQLLLVSAGAILGFMTLVWVVSVLARQASIVDVVWSLCFVLAATAGLSFGAGAFSRRLLVLALVSTWGL